MKQTGITKQESTILQGLAILLMLYHHFFSDLSVFGADLWYLNVNAAVKAAWFGKICVGIFAFVSGYGMCRVLDRRRQEAGEKSFPGALLWEYGVIIRTLLRLLLKYWAVLILGMLPFFAFGVVEFHPAEFIKNFLCLESGYNGAFWYVEQYIKMMLILPLVDQFLHRTGGTVNRLIKFAFYAALAVFFGVWYYLAYYVSPIYKNSLLIFRNHLRPAFLLVFLTGYLLARLAVYERGEALLGKIKLGKAVGWMLGAVAMLLCVTIRVRLADSPAYATLDCLIVPIFVYGFLRSLGEIPVLKKALLFLGGISTYLWLVHLFVFAWTKDLLAAICKPHFLFYLIQLGMSIAVAYVCSRAEKHFIQRKWFKQKSP